MDLYVVFGPAVIGFVGMFKTEDEVKNIRSTYTHVPFIVQKWRVSADGTHAWVIPGICSCSLPLLVDTDVDRVKQVHSIYMKAGYAYDDDNDIDSYKYEIGKIRNEDNIEKVEVINSEGSESESITINSFANL